MSGWGALVESRTSGEWPRDLQERSGARHPRGRRHRRQGQRRPWFDSRIVEVDRDRVKVHYNGWSSRWTPWVDRKDESISRTSRTRTMSADQRSATPWEMRGPGEKALRYKGFAKEVDGSRVLVSSLHPNVDRQWLGRRRSTSVSWALISRRSATRSPLHDLIRLARGWSLHVEASRQRETAQLACRI